jgi:hypothetical protein
MIWRPVYKHGDRVAMRPIMLRRLMAHMPSVILGENCLSVERLNSHQMLEQIPGILSIQINCEGVRLHSPSLIDNPFPISGHGAITSARYITPYKAEQYMQPTASCLEQLCGHDDELKEILATKKFEGWAFL